MNEPPRPNREGAKRPWNHPTNQRFGVMLAVIVLVGLGTRLNACDYRTIAKQVVDDPAVGTLRGDVGRVQGTSDAISAKTLELAASLARVEAELADMKAHSHRTVYRFNPHSDKTPDPAQLKTLRAAVQAGSRVRVTHKPAEGVGRTISVECEFVGLDANGNVQCMSGVLAANAELPDGRRYQEILTHNGTRVLAHWNADGTNIQGEREVEKRETHWSVQLPY